MKVVKITIHPLTKIAIILVSGAMIVVNIPVILEVLFIVLIGLLMIHDKKYEQGLKMILFFLFFLWMDGVDLDFLGKVGAGIHSLCFMARRFLLPVMAAKYANDSTPTGVLMAALEKIKLPKQVIIPLAVMFRFFPTLREEFKNIKNAMKMRGIALNAKNMVLSPLTCMEYVLVPMLASSSKIGDELAAAAHTKGVEDPCPKIRYKSVNFSVWDGFICLYLIGILAIGLRSRFL